MLWKFFHGNVDISPQDLNPAHALSTMFPLEQMIDSSLPNCKFSKSVLLQATAHALFRSSKPLEGQQASPICNVIWQMYKGEDTEQ